MLTIFSTITPHQRHRSRAAIGICLASLTTVVALFFTAVQIKLHTLDTIQRDASTAATALSPEPFPISVNPQQQTITISSEQDDYVESYATQYLTQQTSERWFNEFISRFSHMNWYQNLATPHTRILIILPGERKEQVAQHFGSILNWSHADTTHFLSLLATTPPAFTDGTLLPGRYILPTTTDPATAHQMINDRFQAAVLDRYPTDYESIVPLHDALIIASLLEREAYDFTDMRIISGIIWNRLFINMPLQIDATLQYARAETDPNLSTWWPVPRPADKFIDSPYNTYQHRGLPPGPIANAHVASIIAALNPRQTECLFYFHDRNAGFHCSETYEEHVAKLSEHYGRGR